MNMYDMTNLGNFETINAHLSRGVVTLQLNRPEANNSLNNTLLHEALNVLKQLAEDNAVKVILLEGLPGCFCTGMDFEAMGNARADAFKPEDTEAYYQLLKHLATCPQVTVAKVDGTVNAGGVGLVAACDMVIASEAATFGLSEVLFGLLPACVMPFLIRRVGFQKAQWLALTTRPIAAQRAFDIGLVDELCDNVNIETRKALPRLTRLSPDTVKRLKGYMAKLWIIDAQTQALAVNETATLMQNPEVKANIKNYIETGAFPWE